MTDEELLALGDGLYSDIKHLPTGERAWVGRFIFTCAILVGESYRGYRDRWCYHTKADAQRALDEWDGTGEPQGWHRHPDTGRRLNEQTGEIYICP